ncbi:MAG: hypothetical protein QM757_29080 [Paludibaculum sp.]
MKILFGIDIKQLGFSVSYRKVDDGLWFPATYGTEFGEGALRVQAEHHDEPEERRLQAHTGREHNRV